MSVDREAFERWAVGRINPNSTVPGHRDAVFQQWLCAGEPGSRPQPVKAPSEPVDLDAPLVAYTDGSGTMAHLPCGAGVVVYEGEVILLEASRALGNGTNNHAELSAARIALAITDDWRARPLTIRTDSEYVLGVLTSPKGPRPDQINGRLIHLIRLAMEDRAVFFEWVKGHSKIPGNVRADELAGLARKRQLVAIPAAKKAA